ncbi:zinc metalloproteinase dpy-31-like [Mercenaria mercenaria]|uniref:zinc metalloproteinase dpy-31-like n=1 Tax=Mercenaria mercenaria TaxID=6596 RepID=UPI00234E5CD7|nr:zinc metalloproteinase dpy-31-like [Mercenaria mercenaria]
MLTSRVNLFIIVFINIVAWLFIFPLASVIAYPKPDNNYFPEQKLPKPSRLKDGQTIWDKLFIMRMLNLMERQAMANEGVSSSTPWIRDYVYEGDIILQRNQAVHILNFNKRRKKRKLDAEVTSVPFIKKWPLPINYIFDGKHSRVQQDEIRIGIRHWEENTCITFTNFKNGSVKSIKFINDSGCYSYVGNKPGSREQVISIGKNCTSKGIVAHEIGHALGFWHEHARADRDEYLSVIKENITVGQQHNFDKISWEVINNLAVPYDLGSVMHYSGMQFSKGGKITMRTHNRLQQNTIGQREELSFFDIKLANKAYCNDICQTDQLNGRCLHDGYQDPKNCSRCRCPDGLDGDFCQKVATSNSNCGGHIKLSANSLYTISSPGYPRPYQSGLKCYWFIQSPNGTAVNIQFKKPFMQSQFCNSRYPYLPCEDFVEVRFTDSLGITGGRFCCNDAIQSATLSQPIVTHSSHALILFKTYAPGSAGFKAHISIDSCGGCHNNITDGQVPCKRKETKDCYQTWYKNVKMNSCTLRFWGCYTSYQQRAFRRKTKCYTEEPYCCHGYVLSQDKQNCTKDPEVGIKDDSNSEVNNDESDASNSSNIEQDQGISNIWSEWTEWSACSKSCGGCGIQTRSKTCSDGKNCVGNGEENRPCGNTTCAYGNVQRLCAKTFSKPTMCSFPGFFFGESTRTCYEKVTKYYTQTMKCCCGYEIKNDICQPSESV